MSYPSKVNKGVGGLFEPVHSDGVQVRFSIVFVFLLMISLVSLGFT